MRRDTFPKVSVLLAVVHYVLVSGHVRDCHAVLDRNFALQIFVEPIGFSKRPKTSASTAVFAESKPRTMPFRDAHLLEFGLRIAARDTHGNMASVNCRSGVSFGKQTDVSASGSTRKRKATERDQMWTPLFRKECFRSHMRRSFRNLSYCERSQGSCYCV